MAEQRQPFRFRLPWLPVAAPRPSPMQTLAPPASIQSATAVPFLRPTYRPPTTVQVQPPPLPPPPPPPPPKDQDQESPRDESQVQEPPSAAARSPPFSVARSPLLSAARSPPFPPARSPPFSAARSPATSQPGSPIRTYQFRAASQPSSPEPPTYTVASGAALFQTRSEEPPQTKAQITTETQELPQTVGVAVAETKAPALPQIFIDDRKPIKESEKTGQGKDESASETTLSGVHKQEIERRGILSTSGLGGKQSNMGLSTHAKERIPVSEPRPKPATVTGSRVPLHKEIREDITKLVQKLTTGHPKQRTKDEKPINITSLLGENRGASMHFLPESEKKDESLFIRKEYKANTGEDSIETITEGEGSSREDSVTKEVQENKAYINSNVQSINNSIFLDASVTERNAGVQLGFSCPPLAPANVGRKGESIEVHRAEFSVTPSRKLTYDPSIKRRCLRGLFLESSDSDPDNPEKPRRHGCRYSCGEKSKGNNTDAP